MKDITIHSVGEYDLKSKIDIVFVHGLKGDHDSTWKASDKRGNEHYWPSWASELPGVNVWAVDYPTKVNSWWVSQKLSIPSLANTIAHCLEAKGIGGRALILVGHSMGGLIIKEMLVNGRLLGCTGHNLRAACAAVIFLGTPHDGTVLPLKLTDWVSVDGTHLEELQQGAAHLRYLNTSFGFWLKQLWPKRSVVAYCETQTVVGVLVVEKASADPGLDPELVSVIDLPHDHFSMCKLMSKDQAPFLHLKSTVEGLILNGWQVGRAAAQSVVISYAWGDADAVTVSSSLAAQLTLAGIAVISDWVFRDHGNTPSLGWTAWRQEVLAQAPTVIVIGGPHYFRLHQATGYGVDGYEGLVLVEKEITPDSFHKFIPLLPQGVSQLDTLPVNLARERYNGRRLPNIVPILINELCGRVTPN